MPRGGSSQNSARTLRRLRKQSNDAEEAEDNFTESKSEKLAVTKSKSDKETQEATASNSGHSRKNCVVKKDTACNLNSYSGNIASVKEPNKPCSSSSKQYPISKRATSNNTNIVKIKKNEFQSQGSSSSSSKNNFFKNPDAVKEVCSQNQKSYFETKNGTEGVNSKLESSESAWQIQRSKNSFSRRREKNGDSVSNSRNNILQQPFVSNLLSSAEEVKKPTASSSKSSQPTLSSQQDFKSETAGDEQIKPCQVSKKKKKKTGPKETKEQRRLRREEAQLKELYKPKDSHVHLLNPEQFQKLKGEDRNTTKQSISARPFIIGTSSSPGIDYSFVPPSGSQIEFPELSVSNASPRTSCAPNTSSTLLLKLSDNSNFGPCSSTPSWPNVSELFPSPGSLTKDTSSISRSESVTETPKISSNNAHKKLSRRPITFNLDTLIENSKPRQSLVKKQIAKKIKHDKLSAIRDNHKLTVGNLLDSSGPVAIHRGKIRQKKKKPTKLKKCILKSRELRKVLSPLEFSVSSESGGENSQIVIEDSDGLDNENVIQPCDNLQKPEPVVHILKEMPSSSAILDSIISLKDSLPLLENSSDNEKDIHIFKEIMEKAELESKVSPPIPSEIKELVKLQMHSRKFRPYCDMYTTKELHGLVVPLMKELYRLQDRVYKLDPIKLKVKKRYVNGLKDVTNALKLNKAQMIILAPDIEPNSEQGGLDDKTKEIIDMAKEKNIPYIFSGNRYILGKCIMQTKSPVSAMAIIDKQSVEDQFNNVLEVAEILRKKYQEEFERRAKEVMANGG